MLRARSSAVAAILSATMLFGTSGWRTARATDETAAIELTATLNGMPIPLADVSKYFCDDFDYPVITCSTTKLTITARTSVFSLLSSSDYVTVFEKTSYAGASMTFSQDYSSLILIGWNDRISSFKAKNSESGQFFTDWFYNGSSWPFCCNTQMSSLGGYDNTFSSVERT